MNCQICDKRPVGRYETAAGVCDPCAEGLHYGTTLGLSAKLDKLREAHRERQGLPPVKSVWPRWPRS